MKRLTLALWLIGFAATLAAQDSEVRNPYTGPEDIAAGQRLFKAHCAVCHGLDGSGPRGAGADLTKGQLRHGETDAELKETISEGIPGTDMPATFFDGKQLWQIVAYVGTLSAQPDAAASAGDARRGKDLFDNKGGCSQCHKVDRIGGRLATLAPAGRPGTCVWLCCVPTTRSCRNTGPCKPLPNKGRRSRAHA